MVLSARLSYALGVVWAVAAAVGAWLILTPTAPLSFRVLDAVWIALGMAAAACIVTRRRLPLRTFDTWGAGASYWPYMLAMVLAPVLGVMFNDAPIDSLSTTVRFVVFASVPVLFALLGVHPRAFWAGVITGLQVGVALNLAYAVLQVLEFRGFLPWQTLPHHALSQILPQARFDDGGRAAGLFLSGNHLGYFGALSATVFFARFLLRPRLAPAVWTLLAAFLPVLGNSRSALVLVAVVAFGQTLVAVSVWRRLPRATPLSLVVLGAVAVLVTAVAVQVDALAQALRFGRIVQLFEIATRGLEADGSLRARVEELWPRALAHLDRYPLGYGAEPSREIGTIDSAWLTYLVQGSLPLVIIFALFLAGAIVMGVVRSAPGRSLDDRSAALALVGMAVVIGGGSLLLSPLHVPGAMMLVLATWFAVGGRRPGVPS